MVATQGKEIEKLKNIVKHFQVARSLRKDYKIPKYIKVERDKLKMTDGTFLVEIKNDFEIKEQFIEIDSFLKNGEMDHRYEQNYPDFEVVKRNYENPYKFRLNVKEILKKTKVNQRKPESNIDMIFRIVGSHLYVYLQFRDYGHKGSHRYKYKKLGAIKINDSTNTNARIMLDPVKIVNLIRIFEKVGAREIEIEFEALHIREWKNKESYRKWIKYPIKLTTDNVQSLIMQRER